VGARGVFAVRVILAIVLAILIGRFYFQEHTLVKTVILAVVLFGLAYVFQYTKKRDRGGKNGF